MSIFSTSVKKPEKFQVGELKILVGEWFMLWKDWVLVYQREISHFLVKTFCPETLWTFITCWRLWCFERLKFSVLSGHYSFIVCNQFFSFFDYPTKTKLRSVIVAAHLRSLRSTPSWRKEMDERGAYFPPESAFSLWCSIMKLLFPNCTLIWRENNYVSRQGKGVNWRNESTEEDNNCTDAIN